MKTCEKMEKSKIVMGILAAATLGACQSSKVKISGRLVGADARQVYIEQLSAGGKAPLIDSVSLDDAGNYRFELKNVPSTPSLYTISYNGESVPVLIEGGDRLTINSAGSFARNYTVEGNEESSLLREFNLAYVEGAEKLNDIAAAYARNGQSEEELKRLAKAYSDEYLRIKRAQLAFIVEHKASIAAVYALSQRLPGDRYLFNGQGDAVYYRTVADALEERYPQSPYLASLHAEISRLDALQNLSATVSEAGFPDLEIADMYGKKVRLSSLEGNVVLIDYWSPSLGNSNALNADLKQLYEKYHDSGFEVYQVAVETSKPMWINTVQEQSLPWISVCDLRGEASPALTIYNCPQTARQLPDRPQGRHRRQRSLRNFARTATRKTVVRAMIYFASDIHLGAGDPATARRTERRFTAWLDAVSRDAEAIYLLGDLFDFWFEYRRVVPQGFVRTLGKLAELTDRGVRVVFFTGNHDMWVGDYLHRECGVEIHTEPQVVTLAGKRLFLAHGDNINVGHLPWLCFMNRVFRSRPLRWLFSWGVHPDWAVKFGRWWSGRSRKSHGGESDRSVTEPLIAYARDRQRIDPVDYYIFGHMHYARDYAADGLRVVLLGAWDAPACAVLDDAGKLELKRL